MARNRTTHAGNTFGARNGELRLQGDVWLRRLVGVLCVGSGGMLVYVSARVFVMLAEVNSGEANELLTRAVGYPNGILGILGLLYMLAGMLFLFSPSGHSSNISVRSRGYGSSESNSLLKNAIVAFFNLAK